MTGEAAPGPDIRPVGPGSWADFSRLFTTRGAPSTCWCMIFRSQPDGTRPLVRADREAEMHRRISGGEPVGLLAYDAGRPAGWCSAAPRSTYRGVGGAAYPDTDGDEVWSLVCFFVLRSARGQGLQHALLAAAVEHAAGAGAKVLEAYPVLPDSPSYRFGGLVPFFEAAGFTHRGTAGSRRQVMSLPLPGS